MHSRIRSANLRWVSLYHPYNSIPPNSQSWNLTLPLKFGTDLGCDLLSSDSPEPGFSISDRTWNVDLNLKISCQTNSGLPERTWPDLNFQIEARFKPHRKLKEQVQIICWTWKPNSSSGHNQLRIRGLIPSSLQNINLKFISAVHTIRRCFMLQREHFRLIQQIHATSSQLQSTKITTLKRWLMTSLWLR